MHWVSQAGGCYLSRAVRAPLTQRRTRLSSLLTALSVLPWMTGAPPRSLNLLPHSQVSLQLLQGRTVWSYPVWLQTKHQQDSGTTSDHQTGLRVILTSFTRGEEGGVRCSTFWMKLLTFCHRALPACVVDGQTFGLTRLCASVCFSF